ncbi:hypothetical protein KY284_036257 [Solanum tuberosum]|nr:hypothetical protein KY284_036257 [Solanum tuberosum]
MGSRGMTHNFVPPTITNGAQFIELNKDEVEKELEKWENALILYVVGHEPTIVAVDRFIANQCNFTAKPKVFDHNDGYFLVRFNSKEDRDEVFLTGSYTLSRESWQNSHQRLNVTLSHKS